jgi:DNA mismatch repair protein PMS2
MFLCQAYALTSTDVRLICTNQSGSADRSTVIQTQGGRSLKDNIVTVFGTKFAASLEPLEVSISNTHIVTG